MTNREINEACARKLGWEQVNRAAGITVWVKGSGTFLWDAPDYSGSIAAAWEIVEYVDGRFWIERRGKTWHGAVANVGAEADTAPMTICLAFLKLDEK